MVTLWWMEWCRHWRRSPAPFGWSHWTPPIMAHLSPTLWRAATTLSFSSTTMGQWNTKSIISYSTRLCSGTSCLFSGINILWAFFLLLVVYPPYRWVLYVNGKERITDCPAVNTGLWYHIGVSWRSWDGDWRIYINGKPSDGGKGLSVGTTIPGVVLSSTCSFLLQYLRFSYSFM